MQFQVPSLLQGPVRAPLLVEPELELESLPLPMFGFEGTGAGDGV